MVGEDDRDARLAFVALDEPEAAAARLKARGVLVNVIDRPELCDFTVPSVLDRDPVLVAVGTGGASAGLAKQLRLRLEALLPADLGKLAEALHAAREAVARALARRRRPPPRARRGARGGRPARSAGGQAAPERVEAWLARSRRRRAPRARSS